MATRRMKRTKKHLHHGRRKTNRRRSRNTTKRGGMLKWFAKKVASEKINDRGGPKYGGIEVFKVMVEGNPRYFIGNRPLEEYMQSSRHQDKVYGKLIEIILSKIKSGKTVTDMGPFKGVVYLNQQGFDSFVKQDFAAAAAAAVEESTPDDTDTIEEQIKQSLKLNPNELSISRKFVGYMNHAHITRAHSIDLKKTNYKFDNFTIKLKDESVITGKLEVDFVNPRNLQFKLTLNKPAIVEEPFIECMQKMLTETSGFHEINSISLTRSQIIIIGTVSETTISGDRSLYPFQYLVEKFANQYAVCLEPSIEETIASLKVSQTRPPQLEVKARINMCRQKINHLTSENKQIFEEVLGKIEDIYKKNENDMNNLTTVNRLLTELSEKIKNAIKSASARPASVESPL